MLDIWAILIARDVAEHDDDAVNRLRRARVLPATGLWRTARQTVETVRERLAESRLGEPDRALVDDRLARPRDAVALQALTRSRAAATIAATSGMSAA